MRTGIMFTDQGPIVGRADELARRRANLAPDVEVCADVMVKHATAPPCLDIRQAAEDSVVRGLADDIIVSGTDTAAESDLTRPVWSLGDPQGTTLVIGSGADVAKLERLAEVADTIIVGSSTGREGPGSRTALYL